MVFIVKFYLKVYIRPRKVRHSLHFHFQDFNFCEVKLGRLRLLRDVFISGDVFRVVGSWLLVHEVRALAEELLELVLLLLAFSLYRFADFRSVGIQVSFDLGL